LLDLDIPKIYVKYAHTTRHHVIVTRTYTQNGVIQFGYPEERDRLYGSMMSSESAPRPNDERSSGESRDPEARWGEIWLCHDTKAVEAP
jgi:hypothetical protein